MIISLYSKNKRSSFIKLAIIISYILIDVFIYGGPRIYDILFVIILIGLLFFRKDSKLGSNWWFFKIRYKSGTIIEAKEFTKAKKPAYQLKIDFGGEIGIKNSSAQITDLYKPEDLIGKQILAVVNFPPRQISNFMSEVLVLGTYSKDGVVLASLDKTVCNGDKLG